MTSLQMTEMIAKIMIFSFDIFLQHCVDKIIWTVTNAEPCYLHLTSSKDTLQALPPLATLLPNQIKSNQLKSVGLYTPQRRLITKRNSCIFSQPTAVQYNGPMNYYSEIRFESELKFGTSFLIGFGIIRNFKSELDFSILNRIIGYGTCIFHMRYSLFGT